MKKILLMCLVMAGMPACTTIGQKHTAQTAATVSNQSQSAKPKLTRTKSASKKKESHSFERPPGWRPMTEQEIRDKIFSYTPGGCNNPETTEEYIKEVVCILVPNKICLHCAWEENKTSRLFQINDFNMKCHTCGTVFALSAPPYILKRNPLK